MHRQEDILNESECFRMGRETGERTEMHVDIISLHPRCLCHCSRVRKGLSLKVYSESNNNNDRVNLY